MIQTKDVSPHAPYVQELAKAGHWAALVRYCVAHGFHAPALDAALDVVNHFEELPAERRATKIIERARPASCRANSRPMPAEAPVISALQSSSFI